MELSKLQQEIIEAPYNKIVVLSSAASGKTKIMTEKVRQILRNNVDPKQIAVITFTNMAAAELKERLGDDYKQGLFVGTIHALANFMLCSHGYDTKNFLNEEKFDMLFQMISTHPDSIRQYQWVLLDEAQDTSQEQFEFIFDMINPIHFFICGDLKQSIYQWRGARPDLFLKFISRADVNTFELNENYRNSSSILSFAKRLIKPTGLLDSSIAMRPIKGEIIETPYNPYSIINLIKENYDYKNWAILCRTNKEIYAFTKFLSAANIPFDTFKQGDLSKDELTERMQKNNVKVLTIHSAKGLEWNKVVVLGAKFYNSEERNICYVAATRARDLLIWTK